MVNRNGVKPTFAMMTWLSIMSCVHLYINNKWVTLYREVLVIRPSLEHGVYSLNLRSVQTNTWNESSMTHDSPSQQSLSTFLIISIIVFVSLTIIIFIIIVVEYFMTMVSWKHNYTGKLEPRLASLHPTVSVGQPAYADKMKTHIPM